MHVRVSQINPMALWWDGMEYIQYQLQSNSTNYLSSLSKFLRSWSWPCSSPCLLVLRYTARSAFISSSIIGANLQSVRTWAGSVDISSFMGSQTPYKLLQWTSLVPFLATDLPLASRLPHRDTFDLKFVQPFDQSHSKILLLILQIVSLTRRSVRIQRISDLIA